jgi:Uncharacterized small protein (DUF2158)
VRSGGPLMTVKRVRGDKVICSWTSEQGTLQSGSFPIAMLSEPVTIPPSDPGFLRDEEESDRYYRTHCPREIRLPSGRIQCAY